MTVRIWTPERKALLLKRREEGATYRAILLELNALPGPQISGVKACEIMAFYIRKQNSPRCVSPADDGGAAVAISAAAPPKTPGCLQLPPAREAPAAFWPHPAPVLVSYAAAKLWAERNGLRGKYQGLNLIKVNEVRVIFGQRPFQLEGAE